MKLRKMILCISVATLLATAFIGCGKNDDTNQGNEDSMAYELSDEGERWSGLLFAFGGLIMMAAGIIDERLSDRICSGKNL